MNQFPPSPWVTHYCRAVSNFSKIRGYIRSSRCTTGVVDTGGKFTAGINDTSGTSDKFTAGVVDTGGAPWLANISANFREKKNDINVIFIGLGEEDSWNKPEAKNLMTLSLESDE